MNGTRKHDPIPEYMEQHARTIVDAAFHVHTLLGPGLLENVYETCLCYELRKRGVKVESQIEVPISYEGVTLDAGMRLDILVESCVVIELKAVETILPVHEAQLLTYLKLADKRLGFVINFNVPRIREGIKRMVL